MTAMAAASPRAKTIARTAAAVFGTKPEVDRYWADQRVSSVDVLSCLDSPQRGGTSYATIGVSEVALEKDGRELQVRAELVGACYSRFKKFPNVLATAAFLVINSRSFIAPGVIFPGVLSMYYAAVEMKHLLFLPPFLWDERLKASKVEERQIGWLLAIPVSEGEMQLASSRGVPALEELFEARQIDIFDLERPSVV